VFPSYSSNQGGSQELLSLIIVAFNDFAFFVLQVQLVHKFLALLQCAAMLALQALY